MSTTLAEEVVVAAAFRVRSVLPLALHDQKFFILSVSQNSVCLFEATKTAIRALDLESSATSMRAGLGARGPRAAAPVPLNGGGGVEFHGHGAGDELDKNALERFLRVVDRGVRERLGQARDPRSCWPASTTTCRCSSP
ncbi:MAG: hypothetical protein R2705_25520 [Ilumatobacteraceae bacterium]